VGHKNIGSILAQTGIIAASTWAIVDATFDLENSWLLFIHRAVAPVILVTAVAASLLCLLRQRRCISSRLLALQLLIVAACAAPIVRSLRWIPQAPSPTLSQMAPEKLTLFNANILGFSDLSENVIQEITTRAPDVVTLQEVNPEMAHSLRMRLGERYPCMVLAPQPGSWGMGVLSRLACSPVAVENPGLWVGNPQLVTLTTPAQHSVLIANIHAIHPHIALERDSVAAGVLGLTASVRNREESIRALLSQLNSSPTRAVIIAGDLNASMRNRVYGDIRQAGYSDAWLEHQPVWRGGTWPFPNLGGIPLLGQLVRIDFLFHTAALRATRIELLPESLGSDHRGMIAEFEVSSSAS